MNLSDTVKTLYLKTSAHDRLVLGDKGLEKGAYSPIMSPACLMGRRVKQENRSAWKGVVQFFEQYAGVQRVDRALKTVSIDRNQVLNKGTRSLVNHDVRHLLLALHEPHRQDMVEAFRLIKTHLLYPEMATALVGELPACLKKLVGSHPANLEKTDSKFALADEIRKAENLNQLPLLAWKKLRSGLVAPEGIEKFLVQEPLSLLRSGKVSNITRWSYERGIPGIGSKSLKINDLQRRVALAHQIAGERSEEKLHRNPTYDKETYHYLLSKGFAYWEMEVGNLIEAPAYPSGIRSYYEVYKKIVTGKGMVAYALRAASPEMTHLKPMILFRGTSTSMAGIDSGPAVLTDIEVELGKSAYVSGRPKLQALMHDPEFIRPNDTQLIITGHSLGGTQTQFTVADLAQDSQFGPAHLKEVEFYAFNSPAVSRKKAAEFAQNVQKPGSLKFEGRIFQAGGDPVNHLGECFLGKGCSANGSARITYSYVDAFSSSPHTDMLLLRDPTRSIFVDSCKVITDQKELDVVLDNTRKVAHRVFEFLRLWILRPFIYIFIWPIYRLFLLVCGDRRHKIQDTLPVEQSFSAWIQHRAVSRGVELSHIHVQSVAA